MTHEEANVAVEAMSILPFFPAAPAAKALVADELVRMCDAADQAMWLVRRLSQLYEKWPGMKEVRAVVCSKFTPRDGIEAYSTIYIDGIPSERESRGLMLEGKPVLALPAGAVASADPEMEKLALEVAEARKMPPMPKYRARTPDEIRVDAELRQLFRLGNGEPA